MWFYQNQDGSTTWAPEQVVGAGSAFSPPTMTLSSNAVDITVQGQNGSLDSYWAADGTTIWHLQQGAPGFVSFAPAITRSSGSTEIAVLGPPSPF